MPQNRSVGLGHLFRFSLLKSVLFVGVTALFLSGCASRTSWRPLPPKTETNLLKRLIADENWAKVVSVTKSSDHPLLQIANRRALYELQNYKAVVSSSKIRDSRFAPYDEFLKISAAYALRDWNQVLKFSPSDDLPRPLKERMWIILGDAYREKNDLVEAEKVFSYFLKDYRGSIFEKDATFKLAEIEWSFDKKEQALHRYEELYKLYPIEDADDIVKQRLQESGKFSELDTDAHLTRIQNLRRAMLFGKAEKELLHLRKTASEETKQLIDVALAQIAISKREYTRSSQLAERALAGTLPKDLEIEWRQIYATSLVRSSRPEESERQYRILLKQSIPSKLRETILYRLASIALDNQKYFQAAYLYKKVRDSYPEGRYLESSHWFEAWSRLEIAKRYPSEKNALPTALELLRSLPKLPAGKSFAPQTLYWTGSNESHEELKRRWNASFYARFLTPKPFSFLNARSVKSRERVLSPVTEELPFFHDIHWQRLEAFRAVGLQVWGKLELDRFLAINKKVNKELRYEIADRFQMTEDWANLLRWADRHFESSIKDFDPNDPRLQLIYPMAFAPDVLKNSSRFGVSPFLAWGIMREESRFDEDVISAAGAIGLMQLMPHRGEQISRDLKEVFNKKRLTDARTNIRYGVYHLRELADQISQLNVPAHFKPVLQVAAYNAGIEPVKRWLAEKDIQSVDAFVESIPYTETRQYVKRVLQSAYIYFRLYGPESTERSLK